MELVTESGRVVPALRLTKRDIMDRTFMLYGPSNSGKTMITKHLLDQLKGEVDQVVVVSPTEKSNQSYANYVPQPLIHYEFSAPDPKNPRKRLTGTKGAEVFLQTIWDRQQMLLDTYNRANDSAVLLSLYGRTGAELRAEAGPILEGIQALRAKSEKALQKKCQDKGELTKRLDEAKFTTAEQWSLSYLDLKPGLVLVLDDCAADIKSIFKKPEMRRYFYQNRHYKVTVIMSFQDDTDLDANLRKNAFYSIFCTDVVCQSYFTRTANGFAREVKKEVEEITPLIYDAKGGHKYRKLVFVRDDPKGVKFYHFTAPQPKEQFFGSPAVLELCHAMKSPDSHLNSENPFYRNFQPY
jgi:hypothetical protein